MQHPKITIWAPSHNFVGLYLRNEGTYTDNREKNPVQQQYLLHMFSSSHHIETTDAGLDGFCIREINVYHTNL